MIIDLENHGKTPSFVDPNGKACGFFSDLAVRGSMNGHEEVVAALLNAKSQAGRLGDDLGTFCHSY
jgi:hypothetical protein